MGDGEGHSRREKEQIESLPARGQISHCGINDIRVLAAIPRQASLSVNFLLL